MRPLSFKRQEFPSLGAVSLMLTSLHLGPRRGSRVGRRRACDHFRSSGTGFRRTSFARRSGSISAPTSAFGMSRSCWPSAVLMSATRPSAAGRSTSAADRPGHSGQPARVGAQCPPAIAAREFLNCFNDTTSSLTLLPALAPCRCMLSRCPDSQPGRRSRLFRPFRRCFSESESEPMRPIQTIQTFQTVLFEGLTPDTPAPPPDPAAGLTHRR